MKIAIYSRKSRFTGKGDSVENQISLCRNYALSRFNTCDEDIFVYEDEGFSGGNTERPQYLRMMKDAGKKKFSLLLCYRLDRISRNISDFSAFIDKLQLCGIDFVSIREQFDTSTPMGRAMMYIASVFAQLERETIAERIRDNMLQLAKTGRWLGGTTPTGYESTEVIRHSADGKGRKLYALCTKPAEAAVITLIFSKFLELHSLTKLETYLMRSLIKTRNGNFYSRGVLRNILENPVYTMADSSIYDYFFSGGYEIYSPHRAFDGKHGIMAYNKTDQQKHTAVKIKKPEEWIIAVGRHPGIIESRQWITCQQLLRQNKSKSYRQVKSTRSLLSGLLRCGSCGSYMRPRATGRINKAGEPVYYYLCELKEKSKRTLCAVKNLNGNEADRLVLEALRQLPQNQYAFKRALTERISTGMVAQNQEIRNVLDFKTRIRANRRAISNLVNLLSDSANFPAHQYLMQKINSLDAQNTELDAQLAQLKDIPVADGSHGAEIKTIDRMLSSFYDTLTCLDIPTSRELLGSVIENITWDGESIQIDLSGKNVAAAQE